MALSCPLRRTAAFEGRAIAVLFLTGRLRNTAERLGKITSVSDYDAPFAAGLSKGAALRLSSAAMGDLDIAVAGCGIAGRIGERPAAERDRPTRRGQRQ